jgi:hypothetical protein
MPVNKTALMSFLRRRTRCLLDARRSKSNWFFETLWICAILFGSSGCSPYASKRVPIGNAIYMSGSTTAQNKNINTIEPSLLCGPDAPCLGPNEPLVIHDGFNNGPIQNSEKAVPTQAKGVQILKTSQKKKKMHQTVGTKAKSSKNSAVKVAKSSDKKNPHGVVLSEDLNKNVASVSDNFIPLSQVPDKVYTDKQRKEMYEDKEAKQSELQNKALQLSGPEETDSNVVSKNALQVPEPDVPLPSSINSNASAPSAQDTDKLLTQLIGTPSEERTSPNLQDQKEKPSSQTMESSNSDVSDAELEDIKIPPEAITNITD